MPPKPLRGVSFACFPTGTAPYRAGRYGMVFTIADIIALCAAGSVLVGAIALAIAEWPEEPSEGTVAAGLSRLTRSSHQGSFV